VKWESFLTHEDQLKEPIFYQHISDEIFERLIKETVTSPEESEVTEDYDELLTFEEENAVHYVGGYICRTLPQTE